MQSVASYIFIAIFVIFFITVFLMIVFIWATVLKAAAPQLRKIWLKKSSDSKENDNRNSKFGYKCGNCGAAVGNKADVSPSGDVKCQYCLKWFNIYEKI